MLPYHNTWPRMEVLDGKPHGNVAWRFQPQYSIFCIFTKTGQPWIKELGVQSFNKRYDEIHEATLVCTVDDVWLKPINEGLTIKPSSSLTHVSFTSQLEGLTNNPQTNYTKLEGLTKHPQGTYPTRGPYHPPSFLSVDRGPYHNPHLPNQ